MSEIEIQVNGVTIIMNPCHCGAKPTEADAAKLIKEYERACDFCKEPIRVTLLRMGRHDVVGGVSTWEGSWQTEPDADCGGYSGQVCKAQRRVHVRCWEKIFGEKYLERPY